MPAWIPYSLLRVGIFAVVLAVLLVLQVPWIVAALVAAVLGFAVSYVFFPKLRDRVASDLVAARASKTTASGSLARRDGAPTDEDVEDARG